MIEECGYVVVRYDGADDGLWEDQRQASGHLREEGTKLFRTPPPRVQNRPYAAAGRGARHLGFAGHAPAQRREFITLLGGAVATSFKYAVTHRDRAHLWTEFR
jgi:hypothetical protein